MKKKVLSLVLALCMCLTLLPAQAFAAAAEGEGPHTHAAQPAGADPVYTVEGDTDPIDSAVLAVKAMIDALPDPAEVTAADYDAVAAAYDAFCALSEDQMAAVDNAEKLLALTDALTGGTQPLEGETHVASFTPLGEGATTTNYTTIGDAFAAANASAAGGTITLLQNVTCSTATELTLGKTQATLDLTLDLSGNTLAGATLKLNGSDGKNLKVTVKNGTISKSSGEAINMSNAPIVTLENLNVTAGTVKSGGGGKVQLTIKSGSYKQLQVNAAATIKIFGGSFTSIIKSNTSGESLSADQYGKILGADCAYKNPSTNDLISYKDMTASTPVEVVAHATHTWTEGACACGAVCDHPSIDGSNKCTQCSQSILAKVTMTGSGTTSYYLTVADAVSKAAELSKTSSNGTITVTLLDAAAWESAEDEVVTAPTGTYTIDLNNKNLSIGGNSAGNYKTLTIPQNAHVTIKCSQTESQIPIHCSGVTVNAGGSLTLEHVSTQAAPVTVSGALTLGAYGNCNGTVTVNNGGNVTLNGSNASVNGTLTAENGSTVTLNDQNATIVTLNAETGSTVTLYGKVTTLNAKGGNVTITGGEVSGAVNISNGTVNLNGGTVNGSITVTGGTLNCGQDSSKNPEVKGNVTISGGTVTISKGTFTNNNTTNPNTMTISNGNVTIGGGTFNNVTVNGGTLSVNQTETGGFTLTPKFNGAVTIGGGTVTIGAWDSNSNSHTLTINGGDVTISGGSFIKLETTVTGKTLANYLATGSRVSKSTQPQSRQSLTSSMTNITVESCTGHAEAVSDLLCDYCGAALVATVTTPVEGGTSTVKYYATFPAAVTGSTEGDTITLLQDVTLTGNAVGIGPNRTLDLNGKTLTGSVTLNANSAGSAAPTITGNGTISGTLTIGSANRQSVPAKIMNGTFTKLVNYSNCAKLYGGTFGEITYSVYNGGGIGSLLADGKGFKKEDGGTVTWYDKDSNYSGFPNNVSVADLPIQSVEHNFTSYDTGNAHWWRLYVDYGAPLKAQITELTLATGYSQNDVTYKWYDQQRNPVTSVTGSTYDMGTANATAPTGFTCEISLGGYTKKYTVYVNLRSVDLVPGTHFNAPTANTLTYNGQEQMLIGAGENLLTGESLSFQYRLNDTTVSNAADVKATNAATYTVYYTVSADTNCYYNIYTGSDKYITVTIEPKPVTAAVSVVGTSFTYTGSAITPDITVKDGDTVIPTTEYTVSYSNNTAAGTATVTVTDKTGGNYTVSGSATFTIGKAASSVVTPPAANTLTYTGAEQALVTAGTAAHGTMEYSMDGVAYSESIPTATEADTYTVYYKVTGDTNYTDVAPATVSVTIAPKPVTAAVSVAGGPFTYTGSAIEPAVTVKDGDTVIRQAEYTVSYSDNTAAGTATVTVTDQTGGNYTVSGTTTFTIEKAASSVATAPAANTLTYTGAEQTLVTAGIAAHGTMEYSMDGVAYSTSIPTVIEAGTYSVYYKVTGDTNYTDVAPATVSVTIAPKTVTIRVLDKSTYVGREAPDLSAAEADTDYTVTGLLGDDTLTTAPVLAYAQQPDMTRAGTVAIKASGAAAGTNYSIVYEDGTLTIANRTVAPGNIPNIPTVKTVTGEDGTALRITTTTLPDGTVEESWEVRIPEGKEAVTVPGTITVGGAGNTSHAIDIILPEGAGETDVEFRVSDVTSGTVVILVHEDGTEEVLHDTVQTESGVRITVRGNMRVRIGNRSVTFSDTAGHWSEDDVNYVAARGLFVGIGNGKFGVGLEATRGTVLTVLARLAGVDTSGGATWYEKGVQWAVENGISDGMNPNDSITREQLAAMLYRFILLQGGSYEGELNLAKRYSDAQQASDWACEALCWCTEHGILQGRKDGSLDPKGTATREEIAAMLARFLRLG